MNMDTAHPRIVETCYSTDKTNRKQNHSANMKTYLSAAVL